VAAEAAEKSSLKDYWLFSHIILRPF